MNLHPEHRRCVQRVSRTPREKSARDLQIVDSRTTQAFRLLRLYAEDRALELTARLRVLGKSLTAACPGHGTAAIRKTTDSAAYENLRRQFDDFLGAMCKSGAAGQHYFPAIHYFLQQLLPHELQGCSGDEACRIERLETIISLLTAAYCENDEFTGVPVVPYSL